MTFRGERIQELIGLDAARMPPRRLEVITSGEALTLDALTLARLHQHATRAQRGAFDSLAAMVCESHGIC